MPQAHGPAVVHGGIPTGAGASKAKGDHGHQQGHAQQKLLSPQQQEILRHFRSRSFSLQSYLSQALSKTEDEDEAPRPGGNSHWELSAQQSLQERVNQLSLHVDEALVRTQRELNSTVLRCHDQLIDQTLSLQSGERLDVELKALQGALDGGSGSLSGAGGGAGSSSSSKTPSTVGGLGSLRQRMDGLHRVISEPYEGLQSRVKHLSNAGQVSLLLRKLLRFEFELKRLRAVHGDRDYSRAAQTVFQLEEVLRETARGGDLFRIAGSWEGAGSSDSEDDEGRGFSLSEADGDASGTGAPRSRGRGATKTQVSAGAAAGKGHSALLPESSDPDDTGAGEDLSDGDNTGARGSGKRRGGRAANKPSKTLCDVDLLSRDVNWIRAQSAAIRRKGWDDFLAGVRGLQPAKIQLATAAFGHLRCLPQILLKFVTERARQVETQL